MANLIFAFNSLFCHVSAFNLGFKAMLLAIRGGNKDYLGMLWNYYHIAEAGSR
jgi:hypothetical protein